MGNYLATPITVKTSDVGKRPEFGLRFGMSQMQGYTKHMEDRFDYVLELESGLFKGNSYFGVFDGHGGAKVAEYCKTHFRGQLANAQGENSEKALVDAHVTFDQNMKDNQNTILVLTEEDEARLANEKKSSIEEYQEMARQEAIAAGQEVPPKLERSGSTAVSAVISKKQIFLSNCGDSRAALASGNEVVFATKDHKPTLPGEAKRIEEAGGMLFNKRVNGILAVSRALGDFDHKAEKDVLLQNQPISPSPDVTVFDRKAEDELLVLACDGVWDVMSNDDLITYIRYLFQTSKDGKLDRICGTVIDTCLHKGGKDNMTIIIVAFDGMKLAYDKAIVEKYSAVDSKLKDEARKFLGESREEPIRFIHQLYSHLSDKVKEGLPPGAGVYAKPFVNARQFRLFMRERGHKILEKIFKKYEEEMEAKNQENARKKEAEYAEETSEKAESPESMDNSNVADDEKCGSDEKDSADNQKKDPSKANVEATHPVSKSDKPRKGSGKKQ